MKKKDLIVVIFVLLLAVGLVFVRSLTKRAKIPNKGSFEQHESAENKQKNSENTSAGDKKAENKAGSDNQAENSENTANSGENAQNTANTDKSKLENEENKTNSSNSANKSENKEKTSDKADDSAKNAEKSPDKAKNKPKFVETDAYLSIQIGNVLYDPIPLLDDEKEYPIVQGEMKNTILATRRSIIMKHSNCTSQDCVHQGEVSLENIDERVLGDAIICLPHRLSIRLLKKEEAKLQFERVYGKIEKEK